MMAKKINFGGAECTLVRIDVETIVRKDRKDLFQVEGGFQESH
jgi:hypothetical protein